MRQISNRDYEQAIRLLRCLASTKGESLKEREAARMAKLLVKKLEKTQMTGQKKRLL